MKLLGIMGVSFGIIGMGMSASALSLGVFAVSVGVVGAACGMRAHSKVAKLEQEVRDLKETLGLHQSEHYEAPELLLLEG